MNDLCLVCEGGGAILSLSLNSTDQRIDLFSSLPPPHTMNVALCWDGCQSMSRSKATGAGQRISEAVRKARLIKMAPARQ